MNSEPCASDSTFPSGSPTVQHGSKLADASLLLAIASFLMCGPVCSIPAVILGHISLGKIRQGVMPQDSRGLAMAGTALGYVNIALVALLVYVVFARGAVSPFVYML